MKYKVEYQYKSPNGARPYDEIQDEEIIFENGEFTPIPSVGDSVSYLHGDKMMAYKVLSRHFAYVTGWCMVNIVVTDISGEDMSARLKE
jgi:hypothetical protein